MKPTSNKPMNVLQQQVEDLSAAVQAHYTVDRVLADFGIKIMGQVDTAEELPATPPGGIEAYGEAYAVGSTDPYNIYIWTRPDEYHPAAYWFDIGAIAIKGDKGDTGATIKSAAINANNQLVLTMTDDKVITVPGNLKGDTGPSPKIYLSNVEDGVQIRIENPDGTSFYATVKNGINGQNGAQGIQGPPGYFNILGTLANEGQLPAASSVDLGSAYLIWHAVEGEENGGHYDLYINIRGGGTQVWQNTGRVSAGTYIFQNGQVVNTFNADTKVDRITNEMSNVSSNYEYIYVSNKNRNLSPKRMDDRVMSTGEASYQIVCRDRSGNGQINVPLTPSANNNAVSKQYADSKAYNRTMKSCIATFANEAYISYTMFGDRESILGGYEKTPTNMWMACNGVLYATGYPIYAFQYLGYVGEDDAEETVVRYFNTDDKIVEEMTIYSAPTFFEGNMMV